MIKTFKHRGVPSDYLLWAHFNERHSIQVEFGCSSRSLVSLPGCGTKEKDTAIRDTKPSFVKPLNRFHVTVKRWLCDTTEAFLTSFVSD
jgi:hypothetical protein